ncbi:MAG: DUF2066 domain-containing protein [Gammaproteobacteria bacterium]|nr:DUF2066 domain-containing protein [Gammaproteobacteria bacterium]
MNIWHNWLNMITLKEPLNTTIKILLLQATLLISTFFISITHSVSAKEVEGLFEVSVVVEDQTNSKRRKAIRSALNDLVVRISGQSAAAGNPVVRQKLKQSSAYIQRYSYREEEVLDSYDRTSTQLVLDLYFDEISLRNLLSDADLPLWASNRPLVLTWVAIGNQQQHFLIGTDDEKLLPQILKGQSELSNSLQESQTSAVNEPSSEPLPINPKEIITKRAITRGLPILLPLMDLEDSLAIDVADVWGRFVMPIRRASTRYQNDAILAVQIVQVEEQWTNFGLILHRGRTHSWEQQHNSLEAALMGSIDTSTDTIANQYAVLEDSMQRNELLISVTDIEQIDEYVHLMNYLQNLTSIHSVNVARVNASTVQLRIILIGEQEAMLQAISLDNRLYQESIPIFNDGSGMGELSTLYFRWNRE